MPQKRKRKRTRLNPGPILVLALVAALVIGMTTSSLTSLSKVAIVGVRDMDRAYAQGVIAKLTGIPWVMVNPRWVEGAIQRIEAVDHATYSQNIFGRGRLQLVYRTAIAKVKGKELVGMDAQGVMFVTDSLPSDLPVVMRPDSARRLPLAIAGEFPAASVAELAMKARALAPSEKLIIWFNQRGALCMNMGSGLVILGSCDDLDAKLHALKEILDRQPGLLAKLESLNITEPSHPARRTRN